MVWFLAVTWLLAISSGQTPATPVDAAGVVVGPPTTITELDLGKLKGELRQIGWSQDGTQLYIQTADGPADSPKLRHYLVPAAGGAPEPVEAEPQWANDYWIFKSDRYGPGMRSLEITFEQKSEKVKLGTGSARPGSSAGNGGNDAERSQDGQGENLNRLVLLGETVSEFMNERPIPGLMFSWGPMGSGTIAYTDRGAGHLMLLDRNKHKQTVAGVKDALLPAWSIDGTRMAWVQKSGRKKYTLVWATVTTKG